jgi:hypothetical protein
MADISFIMAMSCAPPAILGLYKYKRVEKQFHPFILALCLSLITELFVKAIIMSEQWKLYYIAGNFYYFLNILLYQEFFFRTGVVKKNKTRLIAFLFIFSAIIANSIFQNPLTGLLLYAAAFYSILILVQAVRLIGGQVFETRAPVFRNALFYIASGCILFSTYFIFTQTVFFLMKDAEWLTNKSFFIEKAVNVFTYFVFMIAVLWMPSRT